MYMVSVLQRLLEGRINQLKGTVIITKCANRTFAAAQWRELRDQLAAWKVTFCITRLPSFMLIIAAWLVSENCSATQIDLCCHVDRPQAAECGHCVS